MTAILSQIGTFDAHDTPFNEQNDKSEDDEYYNTPEAKNIPSIKRFDSRHYLLSSETFSYTQHTGDFGLLPSHIAHKKTSSLSDSVTSRTDESSSSDNISLNESTPCFGERLSSSATKEASSSSSKLSVRPLIEPLIELNSTPPPISNSSCPKMTLKTVRNTSIDNMPSKSSITGLSIPSNISTSTSISRKPPLRQKNRPGMVKTLAARDIFTPKNQPSKSSVPTTTTSIKHFRPVKRTRRKDSKDNQTKELSLVDQLRTISSADISSVGITESFQGLPLPTVKHTPPTLFQRSKTFHWTESIRKILPKFNFSPNRADFIQRSPPFDMEFYLEREKLNKMLRTASINRQNLNSSLSGSAAMCNDNDEIDNIFRQRNNNRTSNTYQMNRALSLRKRKQVIMGARSKSFHMYLTVFFTIMKYVIFPFGKNPITMFIKFSEPQNSPFLKTRNRFAYPNFSLIILASTKLEVNILMRDNYKDN